MTTLTARQAELVNALREYIATHGVSPTLRELGAVLGLSVVTVYDRVQLLIAAGVLRSKPSRHRSLEVVADSLVQLDRAMVRQALTELEGMKDERLASVTGKLKLALA